MQIAREQLVDGLGHEDFFVRSTILGIWDGARDPDVGLTRKAIATVEEHGWEGAFEYSHQITRFHHDAETLAWAVSQISGDGGVCSGERSRFHLLNWISQAPVELLEKYEHLIPAQAGKGSLQNRGMASNPLEIARWRIELAGKTDGECLELFEDGIQKCFKSGKFLHAEVGFLELVCRRLVGSPAAKELALQVPGWLRLEGGSETELEVDHWRAGFAIILAGELGLHGVTPDLIRLFDFDWDWWNDTIQQATIAMRSQEAVRTVIAAYPDLEWHAKLFLGGTLENSRFPGLEDSIIALVEEDDEDEEEDDIRRGLGSALACYGTPAAMATARKIFFEYPADPERGHIMDVLYAYRTILGEEDEELRQWRRLEIEKQERKQEAMRRYAKPAPNPNKVVGRNDPCICGSGKKFKKCCLGKS